MPCSRRVALPRLRRTRPPPPGLRPLLPGELARCALQEERRRQGRPSQEQGGLGAAQAEGQRDEEGPRAGELAGGSGRVSFDDLATESLPSSAIEELRLPAAALVCSFAAPRTAV